MLASYKSFFRRIFTRSVLLPVLLFGLLPAGEAQSVLYTARFYLERDRYLAGEPIFSVFEIKNDGPGIFQFAYRVPSRAAGEGLEKEPTFRIRTAEGELLPDVFDRRCPGAQGSVVYGIVRLSPGQAHRERWLLNEWADLTVPGRYRVGAERRLPLHGYDRAKAEFTEKPVAFARALSRLELEVVESQSTPEGLREAMQPYRSALKEDDGVRREEAVLAVSKLPQPFLLDDLAELTRETGPTSRQVRLRGLEGLARLGTREAWRAVSRVAYEAGDPATQSRAIRLLAEHGGPRHLQWLLDLVPDSNARVRAVVIQGLGAFQEPRAFQALFKYLHAEEAENRVGALLGLRDMRRKESIPSMIAMLHDPDARVRQVANFALTELTGRKVTYPAPTTADAARRAADEWKVWWQENHRSFSPPPSPDCRSY